MAINRIDLNYFIVDEPKEEIEQIVFSAENTEWISFVKSQKTYSWEYFGFMLIKCKNTNHAIKDLLYNNTVDSLIKINNRYIKTSDVIIISPFTRISDILNTKTNGNIHNFLKEKDCNLIKSEIEEFIASKLNSYGTYLNKIVDYDMTKTDVINFMSIKDDFIDSNNIKEVFEILKTFHKKWLIIFNDVDYLKYEDIIDYFQHFNFLYFVNGFDESYQNIVNWEDFLIEFDYLN